MVLLSQRLEMGNCVMEMKKEGEKGVLSTDAR
jgi:hypothetical protein